MGNKNDYLTLEESALMLGTPVSFVKNLLSEGNLGAKLAGGRWMISVRDLEKLRASLPPEPEKKTVHNFLSDRPSRGPRRDPIPVERSSPPRRVSGAVGVTDKAEELESLNAKVKNLTVNIEARLSFVSGGQFIWIRLRRDSYQLHEASVLTLEIQPATCRRSITILSRMPRFLYLHRASRKSLCVLFWLWIGKSPPKRCERGP